MRRQDSDISVPRVTRVAFARIVQFTDDVCLQRLTVEYAELSRRLTAALARKRPSPLLKGNARSWGCGVVYGLSKVNFLFDPAQTRHFRPRQLCEFFGVSPPTASSKARDIMQRLGIVQLDPAW